MKGRPPFRRMMPRYPMECGECGHMLDADDARCDKCGTARPATGWAALSQPRVRLVSVPAPEPEAEGEPAPTDALTDALDTPNPLTFALIDEDAPPPPETPSAPEPPTDRPLRLRMRSLPPAGEATEDFDAFDLLGGEEGAPPPPSRSAEAKDLGPGKFYAGRYRVEEVLQAGGAQRYVAVQEPLVRRVVLTVLPRTRAPDAQQALEARFLRDTAVLARLRHPNLAPVHDFGRGPDGTCYVTEELLYGFSLQYLAERAALTPARLVGLAADVASALGALHEAGVVHRAVRTESVVVSPRTWRGGSGESAQIGRYGLEIVPEDAALVTDVEVAILLPPEVIAGAEPDEATDIYGMGVLLYRSMAGRLPYAGTAADIVRARAERDPAPLPRLGDGGLADRLADVAERCMRASPEQRYPSARALLAELEALAVRPEPVAAPPPPPPPAPAPVAAPGLGWRSIAVAAVVGAIVPTLGLVALVANDARGPTGSSAPMVALPPAAAPALAPVPVTGPPATEPAASVPATPPEPAPPAAEPVKTEPAAEAPPPAPAEAAPAPSQASTKRTSSRTSARPREAAKAAESAPAVEASVWPPPEAAPAPTPAPAPVVAPVAVSAPPAAPAPAPVAESSAGPEVPGATGLSGLWLGKSGGESLVFDLRVDASGRVTGRAKRSDGGPEGVIRGTVSRGAEGLQVELQVTRDGETTTYSGVVVEGELRGRMYAGGKSLGKFSARR